MRVLFDGAPLEDGDALGVATSFLTGLRAYAAMFPGSCALALPHDARDPRIDGVDVLAAPRGAWKRQLALPWLARRARANVLHSPVASVPLLCRIPRIATVHDLPWADPQSGETRPWRVRAAVRSSLRAATRVIAPSTSTRDAALRIGVNAKRCVVVPHATEIPSEPPRPANDRHGPLLILGDERPRKNRTRVEAAIAIAKRRDPRVPDPCFAGPPFNYVDESQKRGLLRGCRSLVHASLYEGFGLPVLEGLAHGIPVVCSDLAPHREIAQDAALFVDPRDPGAIADAIVRACVDDVLRERLANDGPRRAARFSPERLARAWRTLHEEVVA